MQQGAYLRRARPADAEAITRLTLRSKRHWGYDEAFMAVVTPSLSCSAADLLAPDRHVEVLASGTRLLGYFRLRRLTELAVLEDLFIDPDDMGCGFGRQLFLRATEVAREWGAGVLEFESDPFAESFYLRLGAERVGMSPSKLLPGRSLPLLRYSLLARRSRLT
jgi:GNAT superfamily N-acetyltransferase